MRKPLAVIALVLPFAAAFVVACESDNGGGGGPLGSSGGELDSGSSSGSSGSSSGSSGSSGGGDGGEAGADAAATTTTFHVAISGSGACAVFEDGKMKCWGAPNVDGARTVYGTAAGEMGAALPYVATPPVRKVAPSPEGGFCAVYFDGGLRCWANTQPGQPGVSGAPLSGVTTNINLGTGRTAIDVAVEGSHACAILDDGKVKCWGQGANGRLGTGSTADQVVPPADPIDLGTGRTAKALSISNFFTCALLDDDRVKCWGLGSEGLLGNGSDADVGSAPGQMGDALVYAKLGTDPNTGAPWKVKKIVSHTQHTCAILANDRVKCWGSGSAFNTNLGVLGDGSQTNSYGFMIVDDAIPFVDVGTDPNTMKPWTVADISTNDFNVCVTIPKNGGSVLCWGPASGGQLGNGNPMGGVGATPGTMGDNLVAVGLQTGRTPKGIWSGSGGSCARVDTSVLNCWGSNNFGKIGVGLPNAPPSDYLGDSPSEIGAGFLETQLK